MRWESGEHFTLGGVIESQAGRYGDKVCMYFQDDPVTYEEMHRRSTAFANGLRDFGVGRGDAVAVLMENCAEMIYTWLGAAKLGAVEVAINSAYRGDFLHHQLLNSKAKVAVVDAELAPRVLELAEGLPDLRALVVRRSQVSPELEVGSLSLVQTTDLLQADDEVVKQDRVPSWDDPCSIIYTGGTTGPSKGALLSQNYMVMAAKQFSGSWGQGPDDIMYSPLPLFHLNAKTVTVFGSIVAGGTGVLDRRFSVSQTWDRVRRYQATGIAILGSMVIMLWNQPPNPEDADVPIRCMIAAPVPAELHRKIEERYGCEVIVLYGLSEAAPLTLSTIDDPPVPGSSGKSNPLFDVRLFDDDENEVPVGETGEVVCRPRQPHVMFEGYYGNPEATVAAFKNLWFHTGDLGRFDADGNFSFVDRKKDAMRRRGENISSFEVERAVMKHAAVQEVAAHAVPSEFSEDDVKVCVILKPGETVTPTELMDHCVANMPYFAVPRYIEFVDDLPRSPVGRVLKYELRDRGVTPNTWDSEAAGYKVPR